ncbi:hypothetical protein OIA45_40650 (plasmid) [Streptomyces chartreusis]|uniref:hypothetical protein n=1 Tax=Streptomyces chartreusis TaxID=1969 RepID=UPI002F910C9F|nr:hypothetical protein OIA45_40650 [Streptomyces chartreusis]
MRGIVVHTARRVLGELLHAAGGDQRHHHGHPAAVCFVAFFICPAQGLRVPAVLLREAVAADPRLIELHAQLRGRDEAIRVYGLTAVDALDAAREAVKAGLTAWDRRSSASSTLTAAR